jgi:hypothetical protein
MATTLSTQFRYKVQFPLQHVVESVRELYHDLRLQGWLSDNQRAFDCACALAAHNATPKKPQPMRLPLTRLDKPVIRPIAPFEAEDSYE